MDCNKNKSDKDNWIKVYPSLALYKACTSSVKSKPKIRKIKIKIQHIYIYAKSVVYFKAWIVMTRFHRDSIPFIEKMSSMDFNPLKLGCQIIGYRPLSRICVLRIYL